MKIGKYILIILLLLPCQFGKILGANKIQNQKTLCSETVVFIHGFMRSSKNMSALVYSLKKDGWQTENWSYPSRDKFIEEHAEDLVMKLSQSPLPSGRGD